MDTSLHSGEQARHVHPHEHEHEHRLAQPELRREKMSGVVLWLTAAAMGVEIVAGYLTGSMALLADGWHMGTHAFALGISYAAYILSRRYARSPAFTRGTGKIKVLGGYTSTLFLAAAAFWMLIESVTRFFNPVTIAFNEAIIVAIVGLLVNLVCVLLLHESGHDHGHAGHAHAETDHSYRAAYLHVLADALTSVLAIIALVAGRYAGWGMLDPVMGIVGGLLILRWAWGLLRLTVIPLLDIEPGAPEPEPCACQHHLH